MLQYVVVLQHVVVLQQQQISADDVPLLIDVGSDQPPVPRVFAAKKVFAFSITLIVFGGCSMLSNAVGVADSDSQLVIAEGFWCGCFVSYTCPQYCYRYSNCELYSVG